MVFMVNPMNNDIFSEIEKFLDESEVKNEIINILTMTENTGNEHGFLFAIVNDEIVIGNTIVGEDDIVDIEREENFSDFVKHKKHGSIHTHPYIEKKKFSGAIPSGMDILYSILYDEYFFLIASLMKNNMPIIYGFSGKTMKEAMIDVKEYLISMNESHTNLDCANEIVGSIIHHPESWEDSMIIKILPTKIE